MSIVTLTVGTQLRFCVSGSFSPADVGTDYTTGSPTNVALSLSGVADDAGRQSDKADLGANRASRYAVHAAVDFTGETPVTGERVDFYWAPSTNGTQANGNVAGNSGIDAAAPNGTTPAGLTLDEFLSMCEFVGSLVVSDDAAVLNGPVGTLIPKTRYGQMVVVNRSGDVFEADNVEMAVWLTPIIEDVT